MFRDRTECIAPGAKENHGDPNLKLLYTFSIKLTSPVATSGNNINNSRLVYLVGVAPVKPAEFITFRIAQATGSTIEPVGGP